MGERALCYASGSLLITIFNCTISILVSILHFGQKSGNLIRTVSAYTFVRVFLPHVGQGTQRESSFVFIIGFPVISSVALRYTSGCLYIFLSQFHSGIMYLAQTSIVILNTSSFWRQPHVHGALHHRSGSKAGTHRICVQGLFSV